MLSRVADSLYWMSRYMERSDGILRMLKVNYAYSQDDLQDFSWKPVLNLFTYLDEEKSKELVQHPRAILQYIVTNRENSNSVVNIVTHARENARSVQDHITKELWQCLNDYYHTMKEEWLNVWLQKDDPVTILDVLIKQGMLYYGTAEITMSRGEGYSFINTGKYLERAILSVDLLDVKSGDLKKNGNQSDAHYWKFLLLSISGYEMYLRNNSAGFEAHNVVEQVVLNNNFPRSIIYSVTRLQRYVDRLQRNNDALGYQAIEFRIGKLLSKIRYSTPDSIMQQGLHEYLLEVKKELYEIANTLNQYYFSRT